MLGAETATNHHSATLDNGQLTTSSVPWEVVHVEPLPDYRLFVRFIDGLSGEVHLRWQIFAEKAGVFSTLRDPDVFSKVRVQDGVVTWENGLDIAPDATYYDIKRDGVQDEASYARGEIIGLSI